MADAENRRGATFAATDDTRIAGGSRWVGGARALARHVGRIAAVFDASPLAVGIWTLDGRLAHANPVLCDLLARSRDDAVGLDLALLVDPASAGAVRAAFGELLDGARNHVAVDLRYTAPTGGDLWLRTRVHPVFGHDGAPEYLVSQVFDFAERGSVDERVTRLVEETPAMLWLTDEAARPVICNDATRRFAGLGPDEVTWPHPFEESLHPDDMESLRKRMDEAWGRGDDLEIVARSRRADGEWRWLRHQAHALRRPDGSLEGYAGVSLDVTEGEAGRHELDELRRLFASVAEAGPLAVVRTDATGRIVYANGRFMDLIEDPGVPLTGLAWRRVVDPDDVEEITRRSLEALETREPFVLRVQVRSRGGAPLKGEQRAEDEPRVWAEVRVAPVYASSGEPDGFVATIADVSAEVSARRRADQLARVVDEGSDFLVLVGRNGAVTHVNRAAEEVLGLRVGDGPSSAPSFLLDCLDADSYERFHRVVEPALATEGIWKGELTMRSAAGEDVPVSVMALAQRDDSGATASISVVARDISDLKDAQWRMRQLATHDYLTGLPNRVLFYERVDQALNRFHRLGHSVALLYLDLDRFKPINDDLGHHVGDAVLVVLADRIHAAVRDTDMPARIGGDEFAVLIEGFDGDALLERVAGRLIQTLSEPVHVDGMTVSVGVSIGIVAADAATQTADDLLARGDEAMYRAKAAGRGRFEFARPRDVG